MKQVIVVRKDLKLKKGKMSVQVAHASLQAFLEAWKKDKEKTEKWLREGAKKVVVYVEDQEKLLELYNSIKNIPKALIRDAGMTQLEPGTITCFGLGPWDDSEIDKYTGNLKLVG